MSGIFEDVIDLIVPVVGGIGFVDVTCWGDSMTTYITPPVAGSVYGFEVDDANGKAVRIVPGIVDECLDEKKYPLRGLMRFKIVNADHDGNYCIHLHRDSR